MAQKDFSGGVITKNEVEPAGSFEGDSASGMWSMGDALKYKKAGTWPTQGVTPPIDETRLFIPHLSSTYNASFRLFDWTTDTLTTVGTQSQFYPDNGSFVILPNGDICFVGNTNSGFTYKNYFFLGGSSTSGTFTTVGVQYSGTGYGHFMGTATWNDQADRIQFMQGPFYVESFTPYMVQTTRAGSTGGTASISLYPSYGGSRSGPAAITLANIDETGTIDSSDTAILYSGATARNGTSGQVRKITGYSSPASGTSYYTPTGGNGRSSSMALIGNNIVLYCNENGSEVARLEYDTSTNTSVTSTISSAGGHTEFIGTIAENLFITGDSNQNPTSLILVKGDPGSSIDWVLNLNSYWYAAGGWPIWVQGYKGVVFICYRDTGDSNKIKISKINFDNATGTVTASATKDTGASSSKSMYIVQVNRYNST